MPASERFVFADGKFHPQDWLPERIDPNGDDGLTYVGYYSARIVGPQIGVHYELHHQDYDEDGDGGTSWIVEFFIPGMRCEILCHTWPDLLELLAKISPIVTAATGNDQGIIGTNGADED